MAVVTGVTMVATTADARGKAVALTAVVAGVAVLSPTGSVGEVFVALTLPVGKVSRLVAVTGEGFARATVVVGVASVLLASCVVWTMPVF
jgi:hypothetical protein